MSTEHSTEIGHAAGHAAVGHADAPHGEIERHVEQESPNDWGWNAEFGKWASRAGWITVVVLGLLFICITHYNKAGFLAQGLVILGLVIALLWDRNRKRTSWRD